MVAHNSCGTHLNVHWTSLVASFAVNTGGNVATKFNDSEKIEDAQRGTIRASIFTPGAFDEQRGDDGESKNNQTTYGHFTAPEIEKRKVGIHVGEDQRHRFSGHENHPDQNQVTKET